jgi:hypothetical protein
LHHVIKVPLFAVLFYLFLLYCLLLAYRSLRRERAAGELPRHQLQRPQAAVSEIRRQVSMMHIVPIFLYLSIGMHASIFIGGVENPSVISFCILSLLSGFG